MAVGAAGACMAKRSLVRLSRTGPGFCAVGDVADSVTDWALADWRGGCIGLAARNGPCGLSHAMRHNECLRMEPPIIGREVTCYNVVK